MTARSVASIALDRDWMPTDGVLDKIENWPAGEWRAMMDFIRSAWVGAESGWHEDHTADYECAVLYSISTGGCPGNDRIVDAMFKNTDFWQECWGASVRGGMYSFQVAK